MNILSHSAWRVTLTTLVLVITSVPSAYAEEGFVCPLENEKECAFENENLSLFQQGKCGMLLLGAQASSGLFVESDNFFESGPLADQVPEAVRDRMSWWHGSTSCSTRKSCPAWNGKASVF